MKHPYFTQKEIASLHKNKNKPLDKISPVVKLFTPDANATWLIYEIDSLNQDLVYAICDLGHGCVEIGMISISEIQQIRGPFKLKVEKDKYFHADKSVNQYLSLANKNGYLNA